MVPLALVSDAVAVVQDVALGRGLPTLKRSSPLCVKHVHCLALAVVVERSTEVEEAPENEGSSTIPDAEVAHDTRAYKMRDTFR